MTDQLISPEVFDGISEFMDTCYNQVLHDSLRTHSGVFSSRITHNQGLGVVGERLAYQVRDARLGRRASPDRASLVLKIAPDAQLVPYGDGAIDLLRTCPEVEWKNVLELAATADFQNSIEMLRQIELSGSRDAAVVQLHKHIQLVESVVRPYRLAPQESGLTLDLYHEYKLDKPTAMLRGVGGGLFALMEYMLTGGVSLSVLGTTGLVLAAFKSVPKEDSAREITGTVETLKRSVRIE